MTTYIETVEELIDAIEAANTAGSGVIKLKPNTTFLIDDTNKSDNFSYAALPQITSEVTIKGNGATIERDQNASKFNLIIADTVYLRLENITFCYGYWLITPSSQSLKYKYKPHGMPDNLQGWFSHL